MVGLDTNVLVRVLVGDDPVQTRIAERAFVRHAKAGGVFVSILVLAEIAWVLDQGYGWGRATIHARMARLVRTRGVVVEEVEIVEHALRRYVEGRADLADYLLVGKARGAGSKRVLTFDKVLAQEPDVDLLRRSTRTAPRSVRLPVCVHAPCQTARQAAVSASAPAGPARSVLLYVRSRAEDVSRARGRLGEPSLPASPRPRERIRLPVGHRLVGRRPVGRRRSARPRRTCYALGMSSATGWSSSDVSIQAAK
ncbi:MAG: type II toxin-antitoxin system VapC family toxin [Deltaproteobacteria bacterium]|nr:type II toxin-antitoxin system VapC family toxin [Deltaproteobacteria bacterium]